MTAGSQGRSSRPRFGWIIDWSGFTKYQFVGESEVEIVRLVESTHHLPQEPEALEKRVRSAVVNAAACLRELRDGLAVFKRWTVCHKHQPKFHTQEGLISRAEQLLALMPPDQLVLAALKAAL